GSSSNLSLSRIVTSTTRTLNPSLHDALPICYPLRKDFPLRGRFSRAEQVRQALNANPEAHYSMEELSIAEAYDELPPDMRERLRSEEHTSELQSPDHLVCRLLLEKKKQSHRA